MEIADIGASPFELMGCKLEDMADACSGYIWVYKHPLTLKFKINTLQKIINRKMTLNLECSMVFGVD